VMVVIAAGELLPPAGREAGWVTAMASALAGAGLLAVLHVTIPHVHLVEELGARPDRTVRRAYLVAFGLILHDLPEGFAMANAFLASPALGGLVALAVLVHNVPEEFAIALPAITAGRPRLALGAAAASALAEPAGALIGLVAVSVSPGLNAAFLAFAAGAMIYVSFHELVPLGRELGRPRVMLGGGAVAVVVVLGLRALVLA
jgi:ZIP family zinc transporter